MDQRTRFTDPNIRAVRDARVALSRIAAALLAVQDRDTALLRDGAGEELTSVLAQLAGVRRKIVQARRGVA